MLSHWIRVGPNAITGFLVKKEGNLDTDTEMRTSLNSEDTQGEHQVMTEAEPVAMCQIGRASCRERVSSPG